MLVEQQVQLGFTLANCLCAKHQLADLADSSTDPEDSEEDNAIVKAYLQTVNKEV